ncbi:TniQ family protein [Chlorogloeopsis sp. ULAP01]|uniref:TniQ family protein n=1 Tax=Chlorogloeopsis sp. ULAP01 TaxID=3056483 RepID=UPI0025AA40F7|nr:TniQ family protein [Chlorogloeopsis sp. ULAP01]MDM9383346.1 TniQ family protein [Chlorogloeopsis sp. ULAP01]
MAENTFLPKTEIRIHDNHEGFPRLGYVEPYEGESISHYLGRLRRFKANSLPSGYSLGKIAGIGAVTTRWEKLYFNPFASNEELEALGKLIGVPANRIYEMLPPKGVTMKPRPIRLCAACYAEVPCHRIEWQYKDKMKCDRHNLRLLTKCTNCETPFLIPADWVQGECTHCFLPFAKMAKRQKLYSL